MQIFVRKYRQERGLTLAGLSSKSGVSVSHISDIENQVKSPSLDILCRISKALEVPCCKLFSCDD